MGKSPGKWIKTVIFGKKTSKSNITRGKEKPINGKETHVHVTARESGLDDNHQKALSGGLGAVHVDEQKSISEFTETSSTQQVQEISEPGEQNADVEQTRELNMLTDAERIAQEKAVTKVQAAFRGYLARRAFKALRGIIRLQALIRGHLVRRQAVATLHCVVGIVKLQALVRGSRIRSSGVGTEVQRVCFMEPLDVMTMFHGDGVSTNRASFSENAFIRKLLAPSPQGMPLRVQYDETDSNSVQIWLERWSISCPWKPVPPPKKIANPKTQKKHGNSQVAEGDIVRPRRSVRKVPSIFDNGSTQSTSELEKPRRNPKKVSNHAPDVAHENPQNELEKVKRSLRKVHTPVTENSAPTEVTERPSQSQPKAVTSSVKEEIPELNEEIVPKEVSPDGNVTEETVVLKEETVIVPKQNDQESTTEAPIETIESKETSDDEITKVESETFEVDEKDENTPVPNGEVKSAEESVPSENQKASRRASLPGKQENVEDGSQHTPKVPSYMQATQSAKAKLRAQGSPKLGQDSAEKTNVVRRHSLPSPANGKASSVSPRTTKPLQGSAKGGNKPDKSLLSSRDNGNALSGKANQGWRR